MKIRTIVPFLLIGLALLSACTQNRARSHRSLSYPIAREPRTLDPSIAVDKDSLTVLHQLQVGLTKRDSVGTIVPGVAERWELLNKGTLMRFHLRPAVWSDGAPIRAQDFVFGWKRTLDPKLKSVWGQRMGCIAGAAEYWEGTGSWDAVGIRAVSDYVLEVGFDGGQCDLAYMVSYPGFLPQREDIVTKFPTTHSGAEAMRVTGPFFVKVWDPSTRIVLGVNKNFYGARPQLEQVELRIRSEPSTIYNLYEQGVLDVLYPIPSGDNPAIQKSPDRMVFVVEEFSLGDPLATIREFKKVQLLAKPKVQPFPLSIAGYPAFADVQVQETEPSSEE